MDGLIIVGVLLICSALAFFPGVIEDKILLKKAHTVFIKGNIVKFYKKKSNVFDTYDCIATYIVLGTKGDYVCLKDIETGEEHEKFISLICKYSDRCEVFCGDQLVALFQEYEQNFYENDKIKEIINPNCN